MPTWIESSSIVYTGNPFVKEGCGHVRAFTKRSLVELLRLKGFRIEDVKGCPLLSNDKYSKSAQAVWNNVDSVFAKSRSLASLVIVKGRKI